MKTTNDAVNRDSPPPNHWLLRIRCPAPGAQSAVAAVINSWPELLPLLRG